MIPFKACPANFPAAAANVGAGPAKKKLAPCAILSTKRGFLRRKAPPRCLILTILSVGLVVFYSYLLHKDHTFFNTLRLSRQKHSYS